MAEFSINGSVLGTPLQVVLKQCSICREQKSVVDFYARCTMPDGLNGVCKSCVQKKRRPRVKAFYAVPENKARWDQYIRRYNSETPRHALNTNRRRALQSVPTQEPVSLDELMEIWQEQNGLCALTGVRMVWGRDSGGVEHCARPNSLSIDRIERKVGYVKSNVRLICYCINAFRGVMTDVEMFQYARALLQNLADQTKEAVE